MENTENRQQHAVSVLLPTAFGTFLAVSRKDDHTDFGLPGGKVEPGELLEVAAARELYEETGHVVALGKLSLIFTTPPVDGGRYYDHVFLASEFSDVNQVDETGVQKTLSREGLEEGKTFGAYNRRLFAHVEKYGIELPQAKFVTTKPDAGE